MNTEMNKVAAYIVDKALEYGYVQEMEKNATTIQAVRNATAHSIRGIRALGDAAGVSRSAIKPLVGTKLQKAQKMMGRGVDRFRMVRRTAYTPNNGSALDVQNLKDIAVFKGKPISGMRAVNSSYSQLGRMQEPKAGFLGGRRIEGRDLQMPRIENTQRITGPNMREKFKLLNY